MTELVRAHTRACSSAAPCAGTAARLTRAWLSRGASLRARGRGSRTGIAPLPFVLRASPPSQSTMGWRAADGAQSAARSTPSRDASVAPSPVHAARSDPPRRISSGSRNISCLTLTSGDLHRNAVRMPRGQEPIDRARLSRSHVEDYCLFS